LLPFPESRFSPAHLPNTDLRSILIIRGGAIGDFILILPAIKGLRDAYPDARIDILGYKHIAVLVQNRFYADRVCSIESAELARFFAKDADLPREMASYFAGFNLIVSYLYDPDSIFENNLRRSGAKKIVRGPAKIENDCHATEQLARPLCELGLFALEFAPKLFPSSEDRRRAAEFLTGLDTPIVAFHPGSGSERKNWPLQHWIELGNHFLANAAGSLVIVSGEADQEQTAKLQTICDNSRVRFASSLPLPELAAVLEKTIFIGHDSGISHLAAAAGATSILLFGPTDSAIWAPRNKNARVICAPEGDLQRLDVDLVGAALDHELMRIGIST
jgi:heptosyltransferase III